MGFLMTGVWVRPASMGSDPPTVCRCPDVQGLCFHDNWLSFRDKMMKTEHTIRPTLPGTYACLLADVVARWGIPPARLLEGSSVKPEDLLSPIWQLEHGEFSRLLKRAISLTGEPGLGFHIGLQMKVSCHGLLGYAALFASNVAEALAITQDFIGLQSSTIGLRLELSGAKARLYVEERMPDYPLGETGTTFTLLGLATMGEALTGRRLLGHADVCFPEPAYFKRFSHLLPGTVSFSQARTCMHFDAAYLSLPLVMADPVAARLAREQCKQALHQLVGRDDLAGLVRELAFDETMGCCDLADVAERLHMSPRTLQRRLRQLGVSFSDILDGLRQQRAEMMLRRGDYSLVQIAETLGYTDTTNFSRAFRRWTGMSPSRYRAR